MKKVLLVIASLNVLGLLLACSVEREIPATASREPAAEKPYHPTLSPQPDWLVRWLNEPACQPPCWEDITPGNTSFTDALAIAKTISGAKVSYVGHDNIRLASNQYDAYNFVILLSRRDANVQEIYLTTKYTSLELGEIVDRYGFPDEMISFSYPGYHWIDLRYYDLSMVITFDALRGALSNKVSLDSNVYISMISFYTPQLESYFNIPPQYGTSVSPAVKLNGYGDYDIPKGVSVPP